MNLLVLFTHGFPIYKNGEPFLINEIDILAKSFDDILVCCLGIGEKLQAPCVELPPNVNFVDCTLKRIPRPIRLFKILPYLFTKIDNKRIKGNLRRRLQRTNFILTGNRLYKKFYPYVKKTVNLKKYEKIVFYNFWFMETTLCAKKIKDKLGDESIKLVSRAHSYDLYEYRHRTNYLPLREYLINGYDYIFPCSIDGTEYLRDCFPQYSDKIRTQFLGTKDHGLQKYQHSNKLRIVSCSYCVQVKRVHLIIETLKNLGIDFHWTHYGGGQLLDELKMQAEAQLPKDSFVFKGQITNDELMKEYQSTTFDLFINVSESEGLPVSIMEAISFGIPCMVTDVGGSSESIKNELNGFVIEKDFDPQAAAKIIENFFKNKEAVIKFRKNAREFWEENFSAEKNYQAFVKLLLS